MPNLEATGEVEATPSIPPPAVQVPADDFDKDRALETIRNQRQIEKELRAQLKELAALKAEKDERERADLSEAEKLKKDLAALQTAHTEATARLRRATLKDAALEAAQKAGLSFLPGALGDAVALGAFDALEVAESGKVSGMADAIKELQKQRPYLFGQAQPAHYDTNASARGNGAPQSEADILNANRQRIFQRGGRY